MSNEQIYLYRRKGLSDYATCDRARYVELSQHKLFETMICYASAEPEEGDHEGRQLEWERCENKRLREDLAKSQELSVTNILLDVVPGFDGMGEEVFAKSVAEVCEKLGELGLQAEELDSANSRLHEVSTHCATVEQELERLRSELGECKGEYDRAVNKVEALRNELAQYHALKEQPGENTLWEVLDAAVGIITRRAYPHALESEAHQAGVKVILARRAGLTATYLEPANKESAQ